MLFPRLLAQTAPQRARKNVSLQTAPQRARKSAAATDRPRAKAPPPQTAPQRNYFFSLQTAPAATDRPATRGQKRRRRNARAKTRKNAGGAPAATDRHQINQSTAEQRPRPLTTARKEHPRAACSPEHSLAYRRPTGGGSPVY